MKDTVEVIINADGKSCTTVNPLGNSAREYHASRYGTELFWFDSKNKWQKAESERKTYEIDIDNSSVIFLYEKKCTINKVTGLYLPFSSIHKAKIINNKAVIL